MIIEFQNTQQDYIQAAGVTSSLTAKSSAALRGWFFAVPFLITFAFLHFGNPDFRMLWIIHTALAWVIYLFVATVFLCVNAFRRKNWKAIQGRIVYYLAIMFFIVVELHMIGFAPRPQDSNNTALLIPHGIWFMLLVIIYLNGTIANWRKESIAWQSIASRLRPRTAEVTARGVVIQDAFTRSEFQWQAFFRFTETNDLFLLYTSPLICYMLPKRAFATPELMDALRALARSIPPPNSVKGFPVNIPETT